MGHPRPLFHLFSSFQTNITIFTTNICEKCPSSIRCWDSNPQPLEHESPPITTWPGLPPNTKLTSNSARFDCGETSAYHNAEYISYHLSRMRAYWPFDQICLLLNQRPLTIGGRITVCSFTSLDSNASLYANKSIIFLCQIHSCQTVHSRTVILPLYITT